MRRGSATTLNRSYGAWPVMIRAGSLVLALLVAGCIAPAATLPSDDRSAEAAPGGHLPNLWLLDAVRATATQVTNDGAEPHMLVTSTGNLLIGDTGGSGSAIHRSVDGGATWTHARPFLQAVVTDGVALAEDEAGTLYGASLDGATILLVRSTDGGATWRSVTPLVTTAQGSPVDAWPVADRPWLAARGDGELTLVYNQVGLGTTKCLRSTDGGTTWTEHRPNRGGVIAGGVAVDRRDGSVFILVDGILDKYPKNCLGVDTAQVGTVAQNRRQADMFPGPDGLNNQRNVQVDDTGIYGAMVGPDNAVLRVAALRHDLATRKEVVLDPPALATFAMPVVSRHGDEVAVAWYGSETPGDPNDPAFAGSWNVYVARIDDIWGTPTVTYDRLTAEANHVGRICMGGIGCPEDGTRDLLDYFGIDHAPDGSVHVAYVFDGTANRDAAVGHAKLAP